MALWTILQNILGSAVGTAVILLLAKYLGDRSLQRVTQRHSKEQAEMQNAFSIGATSHMATVAFDKHIEFCEEYVKAASNALYTLIRDGTKKKPLDARDFFKIRQKWALWLTKEIEIKLDRFEQNIPKIGAEAPGYGPGGVPGLGVYGLNESVIETVIADLREVLDTEKLTALRTDLVKAAISQTKRA
jgi:hypothetical protein